MQAQQSDNPSIDVARILFAFMAACTILLATIGCEARPRSAMHDTPPQNWWDERGPVVPHDTFPTDCAECHLGDGWETIKADFTFDHEEETGVRLDGAHKTAECLLCHNDIAPIDLVASRGCRGCHEDPHRRMLGVQCQDCHTEDMWTVKGDIGLHNRTRFPLVGAHAATACYRCHDGAEVGNFSFTPIECASCHQADLKQATDPDHIAQGWVDNCDECHIPTEWSGGDFKHLSFPLLGVHSVTDCEECHVNQQFGGQPKHCAGCHMDDFVATTSPNHVAASFPQDCDLCHNNASFEGTPFDHDHFPLIGSHAAVDCDSCHENEVFVGTPSNCVGCHLDEYNATNDPNHAASGYSTSCEQCHMPTTWESANFDHQFFPLTGAHMGVDCEDCHINGVFDGTSSECSACHIQEYNQTTDPNHQAAGFPQDCDQCHTPTTWDSGNFDHSWFPLTGQHQSVDCASCHENGIFTGTPTDCASCHLSDYAETSNPNHQAAGFPTDCQVCHTPVSWDSGNFDHSQFPLTGAHLAADCANCHLGGVYQGTPSDCASCHIDEYNSTSDPSHASAGFPTDCTVCHTPTNWNNANFDHSQFPLTGAHVAADCASCHEGGVFQGTPSNCVSCHLSEYNDTTDPNHAAAGFPTSCQDCHETFAWDSASFDHTQFPLSGAHAAPDCADCHIGGVFEGTSSECASCHIVDYNGTTDPNHASAGFPTDCLVCHTPTDWNNANFEHSQFPLTGAHVAADCSSCHEGGVFQGTPSNCVACHLEDYNGTTDPNHASAGFPTSCQDCHETFTWDSAEFNHSQFPLTGAHSAPDCTDCHIGGVFEGTSSNCASCHIAEYNATNDPDHADAGFPTSCQTCHTATTWTGANFDHSSWPLTGQHNNAECSQCHQNGVYAGTPTNCASCHLSDYNQTNDPNHSAAGFPTSCQTCHSTNGWNGANFDHDFPLSGPHNLDCIKCHTNSNNYNQFTCIECHEHSQSKMNNEHDDVGGYSWSSPACVNCHPNGKG